LSMEDPSTIRRAVADIGRAPYGGDSLAGQTAASSWKHRTLFVPGSQYVLFSEAVLACFDPQWPKLKISLAYLSMSGARQLVNTPLKCSP
jgi:hypothetical protein